MTTHSARNSTAMLAVLIGAATIMILNETMLSVALEAIMNDFGVGAATVQWLITGFLLTLAIVIPATGWIMDRVGARCTFFTAVGLFLLGTVLGAVAGSLWVLVLARVVQATGTALCIPLLMTVAMAVVPAHRRGTVMGLIGLAIATAPALGPTIAGLLVSAAQWQLLLWGLVPLILLLAVGGARWVDDVLETRRSRLDVLSLLLSTLAFGGLVVGLTRIADSATSGSWGITVAIVVGGVVALGAFVVRQIGLREDALLDVRVFGTRNFSLCAGINVGLNAMLIGSVTVLPIYLQAGLGLTALATGLIMLPGGASQGALSPIVGRIYDRFGPRPLLIPGCSLMLVGQVSLWWISREQGSLLWLGAAYVVFATGMAFITSPMMTVALSSLPRDLSGHGSASMNAVQQLGGAGGTALYIAALVVMSFASSFIVGTLIGVVVLTMALFVQPVRG